MLGEEMGDTISRVSLRMGCCLPEAVVWPPLLPSAEVPSSTAVSEDLVGEMGVALFSSEGGGGDTLESEETLTLVDDGDSSLLTC